VGRESKLSLSLGKRPHTPKDSWRENLQFDEEKTARKRKVEIYGTANHVTA
jgi:hypothetical protein